MINNNLELLIKTEINNINKSYWQQSIAFAVCLISLCILDSFIYCYLPYIKKEKETAFIEGSEIIIRNFIINDLKIIFDQSKDLNHLSILKNYSYINMNDKKLLRYIAVLNNQNFSKNLLKFIFEHKEKVGESLYNLNRFGLIKTTENLENNSLFEMHDVVRDGVLQFSTTEEIKQDITDIISKLNFLMPKGVTSRYALIASDVTIKPNLEVLLENAEKYKVNIYTILEFRKNLIDYYVVSLDYYNVEKMKNWLEQKEINKSLLSELMNNDQKINYSWYLNDIGRYEDFAKSNFNSALSYLYRAKDTIKDIKDAPELESTILFQIAQVQIYGGDIINSEKNIEDVENILTSHPKADFDMGLYWFIKARIYLAKGKYTDALMAIDNNIKAESHLPQDTFTAPTYIVKSEILNYIGEYKSSYEIIKRIEEQELKTNHSVHEIYARILTQLSRAELGLGMAEEALKKADIACNIFQKDNDKYNIDSAMNSELAAAFVAKGDALFKLGQHEKALQSYNEGEMIYFRRYRDNYNQMDDISYLLFQGAKVAYISEIDFWKKHFYEQLISKFDKEHPRVIEAINLYQKK